MINTETNINPFLVFQHAIKKAKRGKGPSKTFMDIKNPREALKQATLYWKLIEKYVQSQKNKQSVFDIVRFIGDDEIQKLNSQRSVSNYLVRIKNSEGDMRRGQLNFCLLTEDGQLLDLEFFHQYEGQLREQLSYYRRAQTKSRYHLSDFQYDLEKVNQEMKLVYIILSFPQANSVEVLSFNQLINLPIDVDKTSGLSCCEEIEDDIDQEEKRRMEVWKEQDRKIQERIDKGEKIFFCPGCGEEWNEDYCSYCGHPH